MPGQDTAPRRQTYTVDEVAALLGISRSSAWNGVNAGEIPSVRIGKRVLVPRAALDQLLSVPDPEGAA